MLPRPADSEDVASIPTAAIAGVRGPSRIASAWQFARPGPPRRIGAQSRGFSAGQIDGQGCLRPRQMAIGCPCSS